MEKVFYTENQRFRYKWIFRILLIILVIIGAAIFILVRSKTADNSDLIALVISSVVVSGLGYFFSVASLVTYITTEGIRTQFYPFHQKAKKIPWSKIEKAYIRKYSAIKEYGGWGIRFGKNGKALNVAGNYGLQLVLTNGKKVLIGTQKPKVLHDTLLKLDKLKK